MDSVDQQRFQTIPSSADWSRLRPAITELYQGRRWTISRVCDYLNSIGHRVNTRMIRGRIAQWNLQKNHQVREMAAALRLLDPDPATWPLPEPMFLIRGHRVTLNVVLRFFKRKGITDPFQWSQSIEVTGEEPDVALFDATSTNETTTAGSHGTSLSNYRSYSDAEHSLSMQISTPEQRAVVNLHNYCLAYIGMGHAAVDQQPPVHQFTVHGLFGNFMQEGLAQMMRGGPGAFPNFRRGFDMIAPLLSGCRPMSLAQLLAVMCEFAACGAHAILSSLLRYSAEMALSLRVSHFVTTFLSALASSSHVLHVVISSLRAAIGAFMQQQPHIWQRLYVQERFCDCLYHGKERFEGSQYRFRLFQDQEAFYGIHAGKVLWTLTNVADDQLDSGNVDGGEAYYAMALERTENLTGYVRPKIRFAALQGLARAEQLRVELIRNTALNNSRDSIIDHLQKAFRYIDEALREAIASFEPSSRRIVWAREQRRYLMSRLVESSLQMAPASCLDDVGEVSWLDLSIHYPNQDGT